MLTIPVHEQVIHHRVQHGFPIRQQTLMVMVVEIPMKTLTTMEMDSKMLLTTAQQLLEHRHLVLMDALTPMGICGPIRPMIAQLNLEIQPKVV
jgi:hypothetical protein